MVADEVRALAQRASDAAKDTARLIETTVQTIARGSELTVAARTEYQTVGESAQRAAQINAEIAEAS